MSAMTLPVGALITFSATNLSEHNRQPVTMGYDRIEQKKRMSNGTLRKYFVADKRTLSMSWDMLPSYTTFTVDGGLGAMDLKAFYEGVGKSTFNVGIKYILPGGATSETLTMSFTSFSCEIQKRNVRQKGTDSPQEFWSVSLSLEEV